MDISIQCAQCSFRAESSEEMTEHYQNEHPGRLIPRFPPKQVEEVKLPPVPKVEQVDAINHPSHYGGADNPYEAIKVIEAWGLGFADGNAAKYICRAGKKNLGNSPAEALDARIEDLEKAAWYLRWEINRCRALKSSITDTSNS